MKQRPSSIYYNGRIHTMRDKKEMYEAMALLDEKIIALGDDDGILSLKGAGTKVYDLDNHTVIPGLIDTHTHIFRVGLSELHGEKFIPTSIGELLDHIREKVKVIEKGEWIYFRNTYPTRLKEFRFPTLKELDDAAPCNPVYVDGAHSGQANSYALRCLILIKTHLISIMPGLSGINSQESLLGCFCVTAILLGRLLKLIILM